jgi:hypothetical protein
MAAMLASVTAAFKFQFNHDQRKKLNHRRLATSMRRQSSGKLLAHGFLVRIRDLGKAGKDRASIRTRGQERFMVGSDVLVIGLASRRLCRWTVITPRSASMQILFLKSGFGFCFRVQAAVTPKAGPAVTRGS